MGDLGSLLAGIGAIISSLTAVWALMRTAPRGSDRESKRAAQNAIEATQQPDNVTAIEKPKPKAKP